MTGRGPTDDGRSLAGLSAAALSEVGDEGGVLAPGARDPETRWEERGELGVGGMGRVRIVFDRWLGRELAVKEPLTLEAARRLEREALVTAHLEHPGIVPVYDMGISREGRPWFAMRVVRGRSLEGVLSRSRETAERLQLLRTMLTVIETLAFAHEAGVVHRDMKPANIMIDAAGTPQVIDWGLALAPAQGLGSTRGTVGTPRYMSPEQARGETLTPATDVYALGAILHEVALGRPLRPERDRDGLLEALRAGRPASVPRDDPACPPPLAAVIERATHPEVAERYPDAQVLAADLRAYLDGGLVSVHDYSAREQLLRLVRRWRRPLIVAAVALLLLIVVVVMAFERVSAARDRAETSFALALVALADRAASEDARAEAEILASHALQRSPSVEARGVLFSLPENPPRREVLGASPCPVVDLEPGVALCAADGEISVTRSGAQLWRRAVEASNGPLFIDDGAGVVVGTQTEGHRVQLLDGETGELVWDVPSRGCVEGMQRSGDRRAALIVRRDCVGRATRGGFETLPSDVCAPPGSAAAALHPDGEQVAVLCHDGILVLGAFGGQTWHRRNLPLGTLGANLSVLSFIPGSDDLLVGTEYGVVARLGGATLEVKARHDAEGHVSRLLTDADGRLALAVWDHGAPVVFDLNGMASLGKLPGALPRAVTMTGEGEVLVAGGALVRWDFSEAAPRAFSFSRGIATLSVDPDGRRLAVAHGGAVTIVDMVARRLIATRELDSVLVKDVEFAREGPAIHVYGMGSAQIQTLEGPSLNPGARATPVVTSRRIGVLADGGLIASTWRHGPVRQVADRWEPLPGPSFLADMVVSWDGARVVGLDPEGDLWVGDGLHAGGAFRRCGQAPAARAVALSPAGGIWWAGPAEVRAGCLEAADPTRYRAEHGDLRAVAVGEGWVAAGDRDGSIRLWRRFGPEPYAVFRAHRGRVSAMAFGPADRWLASGSWDGRVTVHSPRSLDGTTSTGSEGRWGLGLDAILR